VSRALHVVLVHYPVLDAAKAIVTTAITNLDIHDIARSARTFGCGSYFLVHPIEAQRALVARILTHWQEGSSGRRIPARKDALALVRAVPTLEDVYNELGGRDAIEVWVTSAQVARPPISFAEGRVRLEGAGPPVLLVFGTGWGLAPEVIAAADAALEPISGAGAPYKHLSVRAACAIALDRLRGDR
jgi:hypothetical protein